MSYKKDTDWDNEEAYLKNLLNTGNDGEKAWAKNQLGVLSNAKSQYGVTPTTSAPATGAYTPTGTYNDADLPQPDQLKIHEFKQLYDNAIANGDTAAANEAHAGAEAIRELYGYSGGADGSEKIDLGKVGLGAIDILGWNDSYNAANPKPTYEQPTVNGNTYSEETERILSEILNREDFSYNAENDPLYAQFKTMYNREGDRAIRDTLAEAAASAGGMNSYAITAAQQANNYYASQLNDKIPELYQLAYEMYLQDKESKVQDLGLLSQLDETQYNRYRDTMSDYKDDKSFAYGAYLDAISQGRWEKDFDYKQGVSDRDFSASEQETARDDVWKLISIGVTPSADLIAKAGMSQTDVDLAVAAVKAGGTTNSGYTGGNGYTGGGTGNTGGNNTGGNAFNPDGTPATTGITEEIEETCAGFETNSQLEDYLNSLEANKTISPGESDTLYAKYKTENDIPAYADDGETIIGSSYKDMVNSSKGWEVIDNGGGNLFGIDKNAIVKAPNGEEMTLNSLREKLKSEGMTQSEANKAIKALQQNLDISSNWMFGW